MSEEKDPFIMKQQQQEQQQEQQQQQQRASRAAAAARRRTSTAGRVSTTNLNFGIPTQNGAREYVESIHGEQSWSSNILQFLHSSKVQTLLMLLLILDVLILFTEIFLLASFPPCTTIERDCISCCPSAHDNDDNNDDHVRNLARLLSGGGGGGEVDICEEGLEPNFSTGGCDPEKWGTVHKIEQTLFAMTMVILFTFFLELNFEMFALRPWIFFRQIFYLLDYFIITVSITLELVFHFASEDTLQSLVGILVLIRIWRFVRIGHGIVEISAELSHHHYLELLHYTEELEAMVQEAGMTLPESSKKIHRGGESEGGGTHGGSHGSSGNNNDNDNHDKIGELSPGTKFFSS